jgi:alpha-amylase
MPSVCFYFQVHQPHRVKKYRIFDIGHDSEYFNDQSETSLNNQRIIKKVAAKCYLPANAVLQELLEKLSGGFIWANPSAHYFHNRPLKHK